MLRHHAYVVWRSLLKSHVSGVDSVAVCRSLFSKALQLSAADNGLQYADVKVGRGLGVQKGDLVRCHYIGRLRSTGEEFDNTYARDALLSFYVGVGSMTKAWDMGLMGSAPHDIPPMREGGKRFLLVPPHLGYGYWGAQGGIPPNATLEYEIELVKINPVVR